MGKKCKAHPKYKGKRPPRANCRDCWDIYFTNYPDKAEKYKDIVKKYKLKIKNPDKIVNTCKTHSSYTAKQIPTSGCKKCWEFYRKKNSLTTKDIKQLQKEQKQREKEREKKQKKKEDVKEIQKKNVKILDKMMDEDKLVNILIYLNHDKKKNYAKTLKGIVEGLGFTLIENVEGISVTGSKVILYYDDVDIIKTLFYPYSEKLKRHFNYYVVVTAGAHNREEVRSETSFWIPDAMNVRSMVYNMRDLKGSIFERAVEKKMKSVYKKQVFIQGLITQLREGLDEDST